VRPRLYIVSGARLFQNKESTNSLLANEYPLKPRPLHYSIFNGFLTAGVKISLPIEWPKWGESSQIQFIPMGLSNIPRCLLAVHSWQFAAVFGTFASARSA